ncbi:hypothetical protein BK648_22685 [Pseudomonas poae]|uniref:Uncharacterized protein n=1 Tax=Pseudomonas poae TaxID=200451 RepID=A0A423EQK7_9PSED|nr:hypothetical protein BK648_22685 [Pseudomonas poae]
MLSAPEALAINEALQTKPLAGGWSRDGCRHLVSQLLSRQARADGLLSPLAQATIRGPRWASLAHRDSEHEPMARRFTAWLPTHLQVDPT